MHCWILSSSGPIIYHYLISQKNSSILPLLKQNPEFLFDFKIPSDENPLINQYWYNYLRPAVLIKMINSHNLQSTFTQNVDLSWLFSLPRVVLIDAGGCCVGVCRRGECQLRLPDNCASINPLGSTHKQLTLPSTPPSPLPLSHYTTSCPALSAVRWHVQYRHQSGGSGMNG